jgi:hypothetical protein
MSVMDPGPTGATTRTAATDHGVRGQVVDTFPRRTLRHVETKPSDRRGRGVRTLQGTQGSS